ncbi:uncharacterized protein DS421_8g228640 [Arachis hypogaea]|nr:uncharacterized protein DS421_8g228640 [Arachis hypogaea]
MMTLAIICLTERLFAGKRLPCFGLCGAAAVIWLLTEFSVPFSFFSASIMAASRASRASPHSSVFYSVSFLLCFCVYDSITLCLAEGRGS